MALLFLSFEARGKIWKQVFDAAGEKIILSADQVTNPAEVTHIVTWNPPSDLSVYPNLKVVISVGAGVDQMPAMPLGVSLVRTLAPSVDTMVRNWVVMAVLALTRDLPAYLDQARSGTWAGQPIVAAEKVRVGILGMGRIGRIAAVALTGLGYQVAGWSRSGRPVEGIEVFGQDRRDAFLADCDVLVCLLPLTPETSGLMDEEFLSKLPMGAHLVQAGRGAQLDMAALRAALDSGRIASAMLDVTDPEPLPCDHWAWADPRVIVTPHIGGLTDAEEGARHAVEVVRATREGRPLPGFVDQKLGY